MNQHNITVGADPEVFLVRHGKAIPAIGLIGGTKERPKPMGIGHVQEDNVMAEFNIPPATSAVHFSNRIQSMLDELSKIAAKYECTLQFTSHAEFEIYDLLHPQARTIGCDPDYNAWTNSKNFSASPETLGKYRTAAGHVHIGVPDPNQYPSYRTKLAQACDLLIGVPSILMEEEGNIRRQFYGKAGCYRPKEYGIEYRVPGNWWITKDSYRKWIFNQAIKVPDIVHKLQSYINGGHFTQEIASNIIDKKDREAARMLCMQFKIQLP